MQQPPHEETEQHQAKNKLPPLPKIANQSSLPAISSNQISVKQSSSQLFYRPTQNSKQLSSSNSRLSLTEMSSFQSMQSMESSESFISQIPSQKLLPTQTFPVVYNDATFMVDPIALAKSSEKFKKLIDPFVEENPNLTGMQLDVRGKNFSFRSMNNFLRTCQDLPTDVVNSEMKEMCEIAKMFQAEKIYGIGLEFIQKHLDPEFSVPDNKYDGSDGVTHMIVECKNHVIHHADLEDLDFEDFADINEDMTKSKENIQNAENENVSQNSKQENANSSVIQNFENENSHQNAVQNVKQENANQNVISNTGSAYINQKIVQETKQENVKQEKVNSFDTQKVESINVNQNVIQNAKQEKVNQNVSSNIKQEKVDPSDTQSAGSVNSNSNATQKIEDRNANLNVGQENINPNMTQDAEKESITPGVKPIKIKSVIYHLRIESHKFRSPIYYFCNTDDTVLYTAKQKDNNVLIGKGNDVQINGDASNIVAHIYQDNKKINFVRSNEQQFKIKYSDSGKPDVLSLEVTFPYKDSRITWFPKTPKYNPIKKKYYLNFHGEYHHSPIKSKKNIVLQNQFDHTTFIVRKMENKLFEIECLPLIDPLIVFTIGLSDIIGPYDGPIANV